MLDKDVYLSTKDIFQRYWSIYGGRKALLKSPYPHVSFVLTILLFPIWSKSGWWETSLSVMPNILGFSLGGMAIFTALGDEGFRKLISGSEGDAHSPFLALNATFVHFIILQILSIITGLLSQSISFLPSCLYGFALVVWFFSYFIFIYAILSALAATMALLRAASSFDKYQSMGDNKHNNEAANEED
ncbi:hypothetical protein [Salinicola rhizosphaerae]|uniref:hypothetical protein n=1 Tax=Salinicola rhizosphaerae TaxID=1443141 RepID=UPI001E3A6256|nr:hypothetical protein [Salinicola rhizosphaerae]